MGAVISSSSGVFVGFNACCKPTSKDEGMIAFCHRPSCTQISLISRSMSLMNCISRNLLSVSPSSSHRSPCAKPRRYHTQFLALADAFFKKLTGAGRTPRIPTSLCTHPIGASGLFEKLLACKPQAGKHCVCYLSLFQIDHAMVLEITVDIYSV